MEASMLMLEHSSIIWLFTFHIFRFTEIGWLWCEHCSRTYQLIARVASCCTCYTFVASFKGILVTTTPITMMLTAIERQKDWVFLGIGIRIYKMELRFYRKV